MDLLQRIKSGEARVGIIGLGYVGLPLAVEFAKAGLHVVGYDVDQSKVDSLSAGKSYIPDVPSEELAAVVKAGTFRATTDQRELANVDIIDICVPTPLRKTRDPDLSYVVKAIEATAAVLRKGQLVILESTTYPGTTEEVAQPALEAGGLKVGRDFYLAFSPERVDPGNQTYTTKNIPKVVGGIDQTSTELAAALYGQVVDKVIKVGNTRVAEMVKLLENTFRAVNIGLVNEIALMCHRLDIDVWEVIDAAGTKPFGFMPFYPGPGPRRPLHSDRSVLSVMEGAAERLRMPLHRAGRPRERRDAGVCRRARDRCAQLREEEHQRLEDSPARRGVQEGRRRRARVAGARHSRAAASPGRDDELQRSVRAVAENRRT